MWGQTSTRSFSPRNYPQEEQESLGAEICRWVLGLDEDEIADIRSQHHVGADAVDQLDNFYEYKVQYSGVLAARALTYRFTLDSDAPDEPEEAESNDHSD